MNGRAIKIISLVAVGIALLAVLGPLLWVIRISTRTTDDYLATPSGWGATFSVQNFVDAWIIGGLGAALINSTLIVLPGSILATALASLAGWGLAKFSFVGKRVISGILIAAMFLPIAALVMPLFDLGLQYGIVGQCWWLSIVYGTIFAPWATLFLRSFFTNVPSEMNEAASMDGAGHWRIFRSIAVPMALPAIATALILNIFLQWSELLLALLLLPSGNLHTVSVAIAQFSTQFRTGGPLTAAGLLIGSVPIFVLFVIGQRWLRAGALAGAVKN